MNPCRWCLPPPPQRERWARRVLGVAGCAAIVLLLLLLLALSGCWAEGASFEACGKLCNGRVKRLSSEGCVCTEVGDGGR